MISGIFSSKQGSGKFWTFIDFAVMTTFTALSIFDGTATVFYVLYLFWWYEFFNISINQIFDRVYKRKRPTDAHAMNRVGPIFMMFVYIIFIIVFFGGIAVWRNRDLLDLNIETFLFKNFYFNLNLLFILVELIYRNVQEKNRMAIKYGISSNMVVLHVSIILGVLLLYFVVNKHPETFAPDKVFASLLILIPFLLLRLITQSLQTKRKKQ